LKPYESIETALTGKSLSREPRLDDQRGQVRQTAAAATTRLIEIGHEELHRLAAEHTARLIAVHRPGLVYRSGDRITLEIGDGSPGRLHILTPYALQDRLVGRQRHLLQVAHRPQIHQRENLDPVQPAITRRAARAGARAG